MKPIVKLIKLGRMPYAKALDVQRLLFDDLKNSVTATLHNNHNVIDNVGNRNKLKHLLENGKSTTCNPPSVSKIHDPSTTKFNTISSHQNSLILVEHEPVYTIGIRTKDYDDKYLVKLKKQLYKHNLSADFVKTNRGGLITFHGPGQLVAYPIIYLGDFSKTIRNKSVRAYVDTLEATIIDTLAKVGVPGAHTVREYPGVWLHNGERKIAFIGIACKRFVTMHGISINCDCDLSWFDHIISCGIEDKMITSISQEAKLTQTTTDNPTIEQHENRAPELQSLKIPHPSGDAKSQESLFTDLDDRPNRCQTAKSSVEDVAQAFCRSFSEHFDCCIIDD